MSTASKATAAAAKGAAAAEAVKATAAATAAKTAAKVKAAKAAKDLSDTAKDWTEAAKDWSEPRAEAARAWAEPRLSDAAERVRDDVTPRVTAALMTALESSRPSRDEALRRASTAVAALRGESLADLVPAVTNQDETGSEDEDGSSGGKGKRILLILLVVGAVAAIVRAVMARQAEQDAAALWQTGEGFSAGSVPAAHEASMDVDPAAAATATSSDAAGGTLEEAVAETAEADETTPADGLDETSAGPLGEGQVDIRDESSRGKHTRS